MKIEPQGLNPFTAKAQLPASASPLPVWRFLEMDFGQNDVKNQTDKFQVKSLIEALTREAHQNAHDAGAKVLRFSWRSIPRSALDEAIGLREIEERIAGIDRKARTMDGRRHVVVKPDGCVDCLLVYDDGDGLGGNHTRAPRHDEDPSGFQSFFCGTGNSSKDPTKNGSKGEGRMMLMAASTAWLVAGHTVRKEDGVPLTFAMTNLQFHGYQGKEWQSGGQYCHVDNERREIPAMSGLLAVERARLMGIARQMGENGLTLLIPSIRDEVTREAFIKVILQKMYVSIVRDGFAFEVEADGELLRFDDSTISDTEWLRGLNAKLKLELDENLFEQIATCRKLLDAISGATVELPLNPSFMQKADFTEEILAALRPAFEAGDGVGVRVPFEVQNEERPDQSGLGHLRLAVIRNRNLRHGALIQMRDHLVKITELKGFPYMVMVATERGSVSRALRDGEDISHVDWNAETMKRRGWSIHNSRQLVRGFMNGGSFLLDALIGAAVKRDLSTFADLFGMPSRDQAGPGDGGPDPEEDKKPKPPVNKDRERKPVTHTPLTATALIDGNSNGFRVEFSEAGLSAIEFGAGFSRMRVGAFYALSTSSRGDIRDHSVDDFDMAELDFRLNGCGVEILDASSFEIVDPQPDFFVEVWGRFDPNRELSVELLGWKDAKGRKGRK